MAAADERALSLRVAGRSIEPDLSSTERYFISRPDQRIPGPPATSVSGLFPLCHRQRLIYMSSAQEHNQSRLKEKAHCRPRVDSADPHLIQIRQEAQNGWMSSAVVASRHHHTSQAAVVNLSHRPQLFSINDYGPTDRFSFRSFRSTSD